MAGEPGAAVPEWPELDDVLLEAKFSIPKPRVGSVSRAALIEQGRTSECRVVGLTAPAGYGKSTMLSHWAQAEDRPVSWVSLDRFDDDPAVLLMLLASAYARISPGHADLIPDVGGIGTSVLGRAAPRLAAALHAEARPFVLMVDDLHELRSPDCHDVLSVVLSGIPEGSQLIAASRAEQPHLARLRASGDGLEFVADDLALDVEEAEQIFAEARVRVSHDAAVTVTERTEGWPTGIYLAAMIARDSVGGMPAVTGDDRYVADYLYRESLSRMPEKTQQFLMRTAVLDQLNAPLCDAVLGGTGSQAQLRELEASNSFLIPLDRTREWFRYHGLFQEFLLGELRATEPDTVTKLHLRAADWYEANGSPALALEHLLNTADRERSVQLVTQLVQPTYSAGQMSVVQRWLSTLGPDTVAAYPPLAVLASWIGVLSGHPTEAERWAAVVDAASFDLTAPDGTASFDSARAMLRAVMCASGPDQMMTDAASAVAEEPSWSPWRDTALLMLAHAHLLAGDEAAASAAFAEAITVGADLGNTDTIVDGEAELALIAMDRGRWAEAAERVERALAIVDEYRMNDYAVCVLPTAAAARVAHHEGDLRAVDKLLIRAMRARPACTYAIPTIAVRARTELARTYAARGEQSTARHLMREVDDILVHRPDLGVLNDDVETVREAVNAAGRINGRGVSPLTSAELRLLPYLQTHLTIAEIGERLFVTRNTVSSEVASIYRKLGVSSRNDAVERAMAIGLLGG